MSSWRDDPEAIAIRMAKTLRGRLPGWEEVQPRDVAIQDCSGLAGGKAYKLTKSSLREGPAAVLHILPEHYCPVPEDPIFFDRQQIAQELLSGAGLSPRRICSDPCKEWFVEEWAGPVVSRQEMGTGLAEQVARLLARVHALDTGWYEPLRTRLCRQFPSLAEAPLGSSVWRHASYSKFFAAFSAEQQKTLMEAGPGPATDVGKRLVTTHGDVHRRNLVRNSTGLNLIDMESACVTYAIQDLCYAFGSLDSAEQKAAFARSYLLACGLPASREAIFCLRLDMERCKMTTNYYGAISLWRSADLGAQEGLRLHPKLVEIADRALFDPDLAQEIVERGFDACSAVRQAQSENRE